MRNSIVCFNLLFQKLSRIHLSLVSTFKDLDRVLTLTLIVVLFFFKFIVICRPACRRWKTPVKMLCEVVNCGCSQPSWPIKWLAMRWTFCIITWLDNCYFYCSLSILQVNSLRTKNDLTCCHYIYFFLFILMFLLSL